MKRFILCSLIILSYFLAFSSVKADSDYESFQEIEMIGDGCFLEDFTDDDYKEYYKKVKKRKAYGWNVYYVNKNVKVRYVVTTHFSFYNDGNTPIVYEANFKEEKSSKRSIQATGSIDMEKTKSTKKFKGGLDAKLKLEYSKTDTIITTSAWNVKCSVDPGTILVIYTHGEGKISNGVATKYIGFVNVTKGGFEIFVATTQTYRMEKIKI